MNVLIAEDDRLQRERLKIILKEIDENLNIYEAEDKEEALIIAKKVYINLFYIDIHLKNSSGISLAMALRKDSKYELGWIIFITSHRGYVIQAFKQVHCYDYIEKPYNKEKILQLTNRFIKYQKNFKEREREYIVFEVEQKVSVKVYVEEIFFIEICIRTCIIHTKNGVLRTSGIRLKEILKKVSCEYIVQCHKSYIVNTKKIKLIRKLSSKSYELIFDNYNEKALLSYNFKDEIYKKFKGERD